MTLDFATTASCGEAGAFLAPMALELHAEMQSTEMPTAWEYTTIYENSCIPMHGGREFLYLLKPLQLTVSETPNLRVSVLDWNIIISPQEERSLADLVDEIERALVRKYLRLFQKASCSTLSELEEDEWNRICNYVDYSRFYEAFAKPVYLEGGVQRERGQTILLLDNGQKVTPSAEVALLFAEFNNNERFCGYLKITHNRVAVAGFSIVPDVRDSAVIRTTVDDWIARRQPRAN